MLHHCGRKIYKHSGDIGDLIYSLPVIRYYGGGSIALNARSIGRKADGTLAGFNDETIKILIPLLEVQSYIIKAEKFDEKNDNNFFDMDLFRSNFRKYRYNLKIFNLWQIIFKTFNVPYSEAEKPWLFCNEKKVAKAIFSRSMRHRNVNTNYKELVEQYKGNSVFVGLKTEYDNFVSLFGNIDFYPIKDFLELAEIINGSEVFIGNQSSPMSIAIALNKTFIQERYKQVPDCVFNRKNARYM